jgi:signal transduction histidine kinase
MPEGGTLTLETRLEKRAAPDGLELDPVTYAVLAVSDTGKGMDAATKGRAFDPFFTTKAVGKGSGVGLATVRELVHGTGGFLELDTSVGSGTTVRVFLRTLGHWR